MQFIRHMSQHEIQVLAKREKTFVERFVGWHEALLLDTYRAALAELVGTFIILFHGLAAVVATEMPGWSNGGPVQVAFSFGFALVSAIWVVGHISGAHFNPAVSIAFVTTGNVSLVRAAFYSVAQMSGAMLAAALMRVATPAEYFALPSATFGCTRLARSTDGRFDVTVFQGFLFEFFATAILMLVVMSTADTRGHKDQFGLPPAVFGCTLTALVISFGGFTGISMNPARSFAPALVHGIWEAHYIYWIGPIAGAVFSAALYKWVLGQRWSFGQQEEDETPKEIRAESYELRPGETGARPMPPYAVSADNNVARSEFDPVN